MCCAVIATQTYESFVAKLKNEHVAAQLIANLRTKIWLRAEDNYTARQAADLCGEIERKKVSRTRNETARRSTYSFLDGTVIGADPGSVGEGITVSLRREHLFTPRLHFADYAELNAWLEARCLAQVRESAHPEQTDKSVWQVFEAERPSLIEYRGPFDGFREIEVAVSKSSLVRFDHNRYSVAVKAARRTAQLRVYAERVVVWCDGEIVGEHPRRFGRGQTAYDPWHYLPVLARKPGALRNGDPFRNWDLPPALAQVRRRLAGHDDGDRQFVDILTAVAEAGLDAVEAACVEALTAKLCGRDVVLNILARQRDAAPSRPVATPAALTLAIEPAADCARYDRLRPPAAQEAYRGAA